jgi:hypothetical protein
LLLTPELPAAEALPMVTRMDVESLGQSTNVGECEVVFPKGILPEVIRITKHTQEVRPRCGLTISHEDIIQFRR